MSLWASIPAFPSLGMGSGRARPGSPSGAHCHPCAPCSEPIMALLLCPTHCISRVGEKPCCASCWLYPPAGYFAGFQVLAVSFGREKGTRDLLHQCWVLPSP